MLIHDRETWQNPDQPVSGPAFPVWSDIDMGVVVHYTGSDDLIDGDPGEHADDLPAYMRAMQNDYVTHRGYSVGYGWAVDWLGGIWELRGWDFRNAANKGVLWREQHGGVNVNWRTFSILCLVDGQDPLTDEARSSVQGLIAEAQRLAGRAHAIRPHSEVERTLCCGDGIRAQIAAGELRPGATQPPTTPTAILQYVVEPLDNYYSICRKLYVAGVGDGNVQALMDANNSVALHPGDVLAVPGRVVR